MKKFLLLLCFSVFGSTLYAQVAAPTYNKFSVSASVGSALLREPFTPQLYTSAAFGYKFAPNCDKFFDKAYFSFSHTGTNNASTGYSLGLQRTMMNDRDRMGMIGIVEAGAHRSGTGVFRPVAAVGVGVGFDFSGNPYPAVMNKVVISCVPKLVKVVGSPLAVVLSIGVSKSF